MRAQLHFQASQPRALRAGLQSLPLAPPSSNTFSNTTQSLEGKASPTSSLRASLSIQNTRKGSMGHKETMKGGKSASPSGG